MNNENSSAARLRRHFAYNVLAPMLAVVLFAFLSCGFTAWWVTTLSNAKAEEKQQQVIQNIFAQHLADYLRQHRNLLTWPDLSTQLASPAGRHTFASWLVRLAGDNEVYLLDAANQPLSAWHDGKMVAPERFSEIGGLLYPWLTQLDTLQGPAPFTGDFIRLKDRVAEVAVGTLPNSDGHRLVFIRYLHSSFINFLENRGVVSNFRFIADSAGGTDRTGFLLKSALNIPVSYVSWQPMRPGSQMLKVTAPLVTLAMLAILTMCILVSRRLWHASRNLADSVRRLKSSEAHARQLAQQDSLTGLPNRSAMASRLAGRLRQLSDGDAGFALLVLNLDRFKMINDTYGHHTGDALIIEVSQRLSMLLEEGDCVGRLGGDEFVLMVSGINSEAQIAHFCQRIIALLMTPVTLMGNSFWAGVSIGVALAPLHGREKLELMRMADIALCAAKSDGRGRYRMYSPMLGQAIQKRQLLAEELRLALDNASGLALWYQPIMDISGKNMLGIEALLRWTHADWGAISPADFIPIAEETSLIVPLGDWVIDQACGMARRCPDLFLSLNVSPLQFLAGNFIDKLSATVRQHGVNPRQLELEITEGVLMEDQQYALETIQTLRKAGFRIALDDFGTGYSSLSYLMQFPVDTLKIDRCFTQLLGIQEQADTIVESVIKLGHSLGLSVTAEGVETEAQRLALARVHCDKLQGFLLSRPQPEEALLAARRQQPPAIHPALSLTAE
ncbi:putative bifunctional diguanylate cyclase/phosphodiesterase [Pantoea sp. FN060301]|uniref:putative bifunctional diguanylate cyclase/phosphodiesterase n=1 Tax=Pantoea sp. FN060301 TaxID=3420380 RepID=UPI003D1672E8